MSNRLYTAAELTNLCRRLDASGAITLAQLKRLCNEHRFLRAKVEQIMCLLDACQRVNQAELPLSILDAMAACQDPTNHVGGE